MMSNTDFLKSVEGKLLNNKRKPEPDMRMEVLLGCTSKRIRREIRFENSSTENKNEQDITSGGMLEKSFQTFVELRSRNENNNQINTFSYETSGEGYDSSLVDDPNQVELFLRQVESQSLESNNTKEQKVEPPLTLANSYSFLEKSISITDPIFPGNTDIDFGVLCANFETLYEELLDSIVSVERWMSMASSQNSDSLENGQELSQQDQHEIMMDLSKVLGI